MHKLCSNMVHLSGFAWLALVLERGYVSADNCTQHEEMCLESTVELNYTFNYIGEVKRDYKKP